MTSDDDPLAIASLFESVPWERMLPILAAVFSLCLAEGILTESEVRPIVTQLVSQTSAPLIGIPVDDLFSTSLFSGTDEIDALYTELHHLAEATRVDPSQEAHYQARLSRLRELQELEAHEMTAIAESRRQLPRGALDATMTRIRALLATDENSST